MPALSWADAALVRLLAWSKAYKPALCAAIETGQVKASADGVSIVLERGSYGFDELGAMLRDAIEQTGIKVASEPPEGGGLKGNRGGAR